MKYRWKKGEGSIIGMGDRNKYGDGVQPRRGKI